MLDDLMHVFHSISPEDTTSSSNAFSGSPLLHSLLLLQCDERGPAATWAITSHHQVSWLIMELVIFVGSKITKMGCKKMGWWKHTFTRFMPLFKLQNWWFASKKRVMFSGNFLSWMPVYQGVVQGQIFPWQVGWVGGEGFRVWRKHSGHSVTLVSFQGN